MENKMKFSILGTGFIFPRHLKAIQEAGGEITGLNTNEDCVVILTPNDTHFYYAKEYAEKGKIVLCEKPLVIKSKDAEILAQYDNIFTVMQLRYHPLIEEIKKNIKNNNDIEIDIDVHRDRTYFQSWKGQEQRSGGILFNIGIHYFDLLLYLFGPAQRILTTNYDEKVANGKVWGKGYQCKWRVSVMATQESQHRTFKVNGADYNFSSLDNLSYENLHQFVYRDLIKGQGIQAKDIIEVTKLVESFYGKSN